MMADLTRADLEAMGWPSLDYNPFDRIKELEKENRELREENEDLRYDKAQLQSTDDVGCLIRKLAEVYNYAQDFENPYEGILLLRDTERLLLQMRVEHEVFVACLPPPALPA